MDAASKALAKGTELDGGSIVVGDKIGQGGFGITYIAYDRQKKRNFVLKEFFPEHMVVRQEDHSLRVAPEMQEKYEKSLRGFIREARVLNELKRHPNIVKVYFFMEENNTAYYGMELLHGKDLRHYAYDVRNKTGKGLSIHQAFNILKPIMNALEYSHASKVLHRDISPDNIFMDEIRDENGKQQIMPKLIDFGAAYVAIEDFTQTFPNVRKNGYSPFEQTMPAEYQGTWCDVYALAATFYALIVGKPPKAAIDRAHSPSKDIESPRELGADISEEVNDVIMRGLEFDYKRRTRTVHDFATELEMALTGRKPVGQQPPPPPPPPPPPVDVNPTPVKNDPPSISQSQPHPPVAGDIPSPPPPQGNSDSGKRFAAYMIDVLVFGLLGVAFQYVLGNVFSYSFTGAEFALLSCLWLFMLMFGCGIVLTALPAQATLGMLPCGLHLIAPGSGEPTTGSCMLFNLVRSVPLVGLLMELIQGGDGRFVIEAVSGVYAGTGEQQRSDRQQGSYAASDVSQASGIADYSHVSGVGGSEISGVHDKDDHGGGQYNQPPVSGPMLVCVGGELRGKSYKLSDGTGAGRRMAPPNITIPREDKVASSEHCVFRFVGNQWYVVDNSTNGTLVNGKRVHKARSEALKPNAKIVIGNQQFVFTKK